MKQPRNLQKRLRAPRAAAAAGILFAVLFGVSIVMVRLALPENLVVSSDWIETGASRINVALILMPFAGIAFLWFIGVIRDHLGVNEDRFMSTVYLGSGLIFLAMVFVSMSIAGAIIAGTKTIGRDLMGVDTITFGREMMMQITNVYAARMAGAFMMSLGSTWWRTGTMPRWLSFITFAAALMLLVIINLNLWVTLTFPIWVFVISLYILWRNLSTPEPKTSES